MAKSRSTFRLLHLFLLMSQLFLQWTRLTFDPLSHISLHLCRYFQVWITTVLVLPHASATSIPSARAKTFADSSKPAIRSASSPPHASFLRRRRRHHLRSIHTTTTVAQVGSLASVVTCVVTCRLVQFVPSVHLVVKRASERALQLLRIAPAAAASRKRSCGRSWKADVEGTMAMARARTAWRVARNSQSRWMGSIYDDREKGEEVRASACARERKEREVRR